MIGLFLRYTELSTPSSYCSFHWITRDGVINGNGRKWKRSNSCDIDSVELMTPLTTLIFNFHRVVIISALTIPITTQNSIPSLLKTTINQPMLREDFNRVCEAKFLYIKSMVAV